METEEAGSPSPDDAVLFFGVALVLGIASRHLLRGTRVPYTVALLVLGVALGGLEYGTKHGLGKLGAGIRIWSAINPDLLLAVFLPALLFESSFSMEVHQIKKCMAQMVLLAVPGVVISTVLLGAAVKLTFPYDWNWKTSFLFSGLLSATDPVAVVALLKDLGASKKLSTIIEGESLMNDGTAIVVYQLFYRMVLGKTFDAGSIIKFLSQVSLGAVALGLAFGIASVLWLGFIFNDTIIEISLTLAVSYIAFFTAQDALEVSGVLAVMTLGMFYAAFAKTAFKGDSQQSLHHFWEMVAYIANTLIFILSGVVIADGVLQDNIHFERHGTSWGFLVLLYVFVQISRAVVVGVLYPLLRHFGYGMDIKEATVLVWSGLRGAVALSLSLSVKRASDSVQTYLKPEVGTMFVFFTGGIVFLTLILNGSTTQFLLHLLGLGKLSATKNAGSWPLHLTYYGPPSEDLHVDWRNKDGVVDMEHYSTELFAAMDKHSFWSMHTCTRPQFGPNVSAEYVIDPLLKDTFLANPRFSYLLPLIGHKVASAAEAPNSTTQFGTTTGYWQRDGSIEVPVREVAALKISDN
ncbi:sodium/hydrogen exchanger 7-like [Triticum dicoccoides]|uniref:sodium/hydrogen exchanger 7-like n=1 Tax=Triticum dicoccoides TaxID=85692 RepID=UPI000E7892B5|nr:sodium/hydrogen exchanger 7-like [Triticum dicoccoides]